MSDHKQEFENFMEALEAKNYTYNFNEAVPINVLGRFSPPYDEFDNFDDLHVHSPEFLRLT